MHLAGDTPAGVCVPGLAVKDLAAFHRKRKAKKVKCLKPPRVARDFGGKLAMYADPDGLRLSVGEMPGS